MKKKKLLYCIHKFSGREFDSPVQNFTKKNPFQKEVG